MNNSEWLQELKAGDNVIVSNRHGSTIMAVEKVTATQIVIKDGRRWRVKDGRLVGEDSAWSYSHLQQATPERMAEINAARRRDNLAFKMESTKWREVAADKLERIAVILDEPAPGVGE